jgi:hypothetical protein
MSFGAASQIPAEKLMDTLGGDGAVFFIGQGRSDFAPCPAPLALLADKIHERFETAVEGASAARAFSFGQLLAADDFRIHQSEFRTFRVNTVNG